MHYNLYQAVARRRGSRQPPRPWTVPAPATGRHPPRSPEHEPTHVSAPSEQR
ncbi:hypothetical protein T484DRAFT_1935317 [Baffinella frigidus]|nr:hypothetical protein T484DRAFT_1935317 [Cryptophyta sp. CCMP2293]